MKTKIIFTSLLSLFTLSSCSLNFNFFGTGTNSSISSNNTETSNDSTQLTSLSSSSNIISSSSDNVNSSNSYKNRDTSSNIDSISSSISSYTSSSSISSIQDPYTNISSSTFYSSYTPATSYIDSYYRTKHGFMSGSIDLSFTSTTSNFSSQPKEDNKYVKYYTSSYEDNGNTYVVYDYNLNVVDKIYKGGGYVTVNQVASYIQAFGDVPGNYFAQKTVNSSSIWGQYSRYNHSYFSNDTTKYTTEPDLPGSGTLYDYYELDIGGKNYNNSTNTKITRGTLRIVYSRYNYGLTSLVSNSERKVFYTYDHYYNFQEYLNYQDGFGEKFGYNSSTKKISSYPEVSIKSI